MSDKPEPKAEALKSCPFCPAGSNHHVVVDEVDTLCGPRYAGQCNLCGSTGPMRQAKAEATRLWNGRTAAQPTEFPLKVGTPEHAAYCEEMAACEQEARQMLVDMDVVGVHTLLDEQIIQLVLLIKDRRRAAVRIAELEAAMEAFPV